MREKIISMLVILAIILSATIPSFAAYTNITLEPIKECSPIIVLLLLNPS